MSTINFLLANYSLNYYNLPILLVAFATFLVGVFTLLKNQLSALYVSFLFFTTVVASWAVSLSFLLTSTDPKWAKFWGNTLMSLIASIPPVLYAFVCFLNDRVSEEKPFLFASFIGTIILSLIMFLTDFVTAGVHGYRWGFYPENGSFSVGYFIFFGLCLVKIIHVFYREIQNKDNVSLHIQRNRTLLIGTILGYLAVVDFIPFYGISMRPFGYIFILAGITVYAFAIWEYELAGLTDSRIASRIFMAIDEAVFVTDKSGKIQLANQSAGDIIGKDEEAIVSEDIQNYISLKNQDIDMIELVDQDKSIKKELECYLTGADGDDYHVRLKTSIIGEEVKGPFRDSWKMFVAKDTTKLKQTQSKLEQRTYKNDVTGLPNQKKFDQDLESDKLPDRCKTAIYIIAEDLKSIHTNIENPEQYYFLLRSIASRLKAFLPTDNIYQVNDHEFFAYTEGEKNIAEKFEKQKDNLTSAVDLGDSRIRVHYAIGITGEGPLEDAFRQSQSMAINDAQQEPGTTISRYDEESTKEHQRFFDVKHELVDAIEKNKLKIKFHPQIEKKMLRGAEALIRWQHDRHGYIIPPKIIQAAIEMNEENTLLKFVLERSMTEAKNWSRGKTLSVNISSKQLQHGERLISLINEVSNRTGFPLKQLEIELTEQAAVRNINETKKILDELKKENINISLDDFGTGYSSFKSLIDLPIDNLKIDKSFILNLDQEQQNILHLNQEKKKKRIVEATAEMAEGLNVDVIAEGVETEAHIEYLESINVNVMQGFYWTEPIPPDDYRKFEREF